jgi:hypothetical protein
MVSRRSVVVLIFDNRTIPQEFFFSYYIILGALVVANIPNRKWLVLNLYLLHGFFWAKIHMVFMLGFVICVLHTDGYLDLLRKPSTRIGLIAATCFKLSIATYLYYSLCTAEGNKSMVEIGHSVFQCQLDNGNLSCEETLDVMLGAPLIVLLADISPFVQRLLSIYPLPIIGQISFGVYLAHGPLLPLMKVCLAFLLKLEVDSVFAFYTSLSVLYLASIMLGYLVVTYLDGPAVSLVEKGYKLLFETPEEEFSIIDYVVSKVDVFRRNWKEALIEQIQHNKKID